MKVHRIDVRAVTGMGRTHTYEGVQVYRCKSRHQGGRMTRFEIGYVSAQGTYRTVKDGPLLHGPYAYPIALVGSIAEFGGTGFDSSARVAHGLEFDAAVGDYFLIDGELFELRDDRPAHDPRLAHIPTVARVLGDLTADDKGKHFLCETALVIENGPTAWAGVLHGVQQRPELNRLDAAGSTIVEVEHPGSNMSFYQHASTPILVEV
jgi:hypothetical protein